MKKRGFTLVELLVVVAIISILAGLMMASLSSSRAKSRDGVRKSDINQIRTAVEQAGIDTGAYPPATTTTVLGRTCEKWRQGGALGSAMTAIQTAQYASVVPRPPRPLEDYGYATNAADYSLFPVGQAATNVPPTGPGLLTVANSQYVLEARLERPSDPTKSLWHVRSNGTSSEHPGGVPMALDSAGC